jgi:hypothetical protein
MSEYVKRGTRIYVNDDDKERRWSFDVRADSSAMNYLLYLCPTTKDAMAKLAKMRRAIRALTPDTKGQP